MDREVSSAEDTRERLIRAAAQLFAEKGYEGASVKELASVAGVNVSLVSYHFGGKEGLFKAALEQFGKEGLGAAERILTPPASAEELQIRLKLFIEEAYRIQLSQPQLCRIRHRECDLQSPIALDIFKNTFHRVFEKLAGFVESARKKGLLKEDLNAQIATIQLFGALVHPIRMAPIAKETLGVSIYDAPFREQVIEHLVTLFLRGFGK
jgi:TetR/AcrR family transcriptional regulator